jgi:hypothetical protein
MARSPNLTCVTLPASTWCRKSEKASIGGSGGRRT